MNNITLSNENAKNLKLFEKTLHKDRETVISEALALYFEAHYKKTQDAKDAQTNLSYEEFWDGVDL